MSGRFTQVVLYAQNFIFNVHADLTIGARVLTFALSFVCEQPCSKPSCASHRSKLNVIIHLEIIFETDIENNGLLSLSSELGKRDQM